MTDSSNVSTAKPKFGGSVHRAPVGTKLPTDATSTLDAAFKSLGYIHEDGVTNGNSIESESTKAWGGDIVDTSQTSKEDTFSFTMIESMNVEVLKTYHGDENVEGTLDTGITVKVNSRQDKNHAYVVDMVLKNEAIKRIVIPDASISEMGEVVYKDSEPIGYNVTLKCNADSDGNYHYEYIHKAA